MKKTGMEKLDAITSATLIGGVDIALNVHWARFVDYRGIEQGAAIRFENNKNGFRNIVDQINNLCRLKRFNKAIIGMEPTGPYWKALAWYLRKEGIEVVMVNPAHTKRSKELDDNSPTKNDKKDALVIAKLVKDGRYFEPYLPTDTYAELRMLTNNRNAVVKRMNILENNISTLLAEYFPELTTVFKYPLRSKAALQILKNCPFPKLILQLGVQGVLAEIRKAVKATVGELKVRELIKAAENTVGVQHGLYSAELKLKLMLEELELLRRHEEKLEEEMEQRLIQTGYADQMLSIKGVGLVTAASFLGEIGDPMRFENHRQISRLAGYNLVEDSSGKNRSGTSISKRGRKSLRALLYRMAMVMVAKNSEIKPLYDYLKSRKNNPLKGKQALIVIAKKIIAIIFTLLKNQTTYNPDLVLGEFRKEQLRLAA